MKELEQALQHYREHFQQVKDELPGKALPWLNELREQALSDFINQGFPTKKNEEWKYSSTLALAKHAFAAQKHDASINQQLLQQHLLFEQQCQRMVFVDGYFIASLSQLSSLPKGVLLTSLSDAVESHSSLVQTHLNNDEQQPSFTALNTAFMQDGYFLYLPKHAVVEQPIHIIYLTTQSEQFINLRNVCIAEENSQANIVEHYVGHTEQAYFNNVLSQLDLAQSAAINHYKIIEEGDAGFHIGTAQVLQQQQSHFHSYSFAFNGAWTRSDTEVTFTQANAECSLDGLYVLNQQQHIDHHTRIAHNHPHCSSREFYKGILDDKSRAVFNGKVYVAQDAQQTNADQSNKNLLLSRQAEIDTKPQLEIYADDVRCTHGATVGQLDEKALFYLQSRGINQPEAKQLLINAFANEVIERVSHDALKQQLALRVTRKLSQESDA